MFLELLSLSYYCLPLCFGPIVWRFDLIVLQADLVFGSMAANRESSVEESEWAGISESGDDDMDFEVGLPV